jgi:hypothetical protein
MGNTIVIQKRVAKMLTFKHNEWYFKRIMASKFAFNGMPDHP